MLWWALGILESEFWKTGGEDFGDKHRRNGL